MSDVPISQELREVAEKERKQRRRTMILVSVPGFPPQDPGRLMLWEPRSTPAKAAREIKRLEKKMPDYVWSKELLTYTEGRAIKLKQFNARELYRRNQRVAPAS